MTTRQRILARLRRAAPGDAVAAPDCDVVRDSAVFGDCPGGRGELLERFVEELESLRGEAHVVQSEAAAATRLGELLRTSEEGPWIAQSSSLLDAVLATDGKLAEAVAGADRLGIPSPDLATYAAGISCCDCLVARTGSVVLGSDTAGGRRLTVLPPFHIVVARESQLLGSLDEALEVLGKRPDWSYATIISGPSRTADIEKILVLGAHGPKRLAVVVIRGQ